ncbi:MAG: hypothetical protein ACI9QC_000411 [Oceanicoccus sp.]
MTNECNPIKTFVYIYIKTLLMALDSNEFSGVEPMTRKALPQTIRSLLMASTLLMTACLGPEAVPAPADDCECDDETSRDTDSGSAEVDDTAEPDTAEPDTGVEVEEIVEREDNLSPWPTASGSVNLLELVLEDISDFEASGIVWHDTRKTWFVVSDKGDLAEIDSYGSVKGLWEIPGDCEGITMNPENPDVVYIAFESDESIVSDGSVVRGFDITRGEYTNESCSLDLDTLENAGFEGLTFVPNHNAQFLRGEGVWATDPAGFFLAIGQYVSEIRVYPASLCVDDAELTSIETLDVSDTDGAGLHYDSRTWRLYVDFDAQNRLDVHRLDWATSSDPVLSYTFPEVGSHVYEEGFTLGEITCAVNDEPSDCTAFVGIAYDDKAIRIFSDFPVTMQQEIPRD